MKIETERLLSLIEFSKEVTKLQNSPVCNVASHKDFYRYEHQLQELPGLSFNCEEETSEIWLRVERLRESNAPIPKEPLLELWLDLSNNPLKEPSLKTAVEVTELSKAGFMDLSEDNRPDDTLFISLQEFKQAEEVRNYLKDYLNTEWKSWSKEEQKRRKTIGLYRELFTLKHRLAGMVGNSDIECVWGIGIVVWDMKGTKVSYPLISQMVNISINETTSAIEISPRSTESHLEIEIYETEDNVGAIELSKTYKEFVSTNSQIFSPFNKSTFENILRLAVSCLDSQGVYWPEETTDDDRSLPNASEELKITNTWVLFVRPRNKNTFIHDLENFKHDLTQNPDAELPNAICSVMTEPPEIHQDVRLPDFRGISIVRRYEEPSTKEDQKIADLHFPMPFNEEQARIVQMLEKHDGVVVQGPPGTGKTHTIANIVSHYLANGKRILVTSMKEPALDVLRDKLPAEIRPLAVSILTKEQEGMEQFEYAISKIASEIQIIDQKVYEKDIAALKDMLDRLHGEIAQIDRKMSDWAKKNLQPILIDNQSILPVDTAREVVKGEGQHEWLTDRLLLQDNPLFNNKDIARLREARRIVVNDIAYLDAQLPAVSSLPDSREIIHLHHDLLRYAALQSDIQAGKIPSLTDCEHETFTQVLSLSKKIETQISRYQKISEFFEKYKSVQVLLQQSSSQLMETFNSLGAEIQNAIDEKHRFLLKPVSMPNDTEVDENIIVAVQNKIAGKSPFGFAGLLGKGVVKKKFEKLLVLERPPDSVEEWKHVYDWIILHKRFRELVIRWNAIATEMKLECFAPIEASHVLKANEYYSQYSEVQFFIDCETEIKGHIQTIFSGWTGCLVEANLESMHELKLILDQHILKEQLLQAWIKKENLEETLCGYQGNIIEEIKLFLKESLGNPSTTEIQLQTKWSEFMEELKRLHSLEPSFSDIIEICNRIEQSGAKLWADRLRTEPPQTTIDLALPDHWQSAWRLCKLSNFLESVDPRKELKKLSDDRQKAISHLAKAYVTIVEKCTWLKLSQNANPKIRTALEAFRTSIIKIGKGMGKRAAILRQVARNASQEAAKAIPCWIMSHLKISEYLPSQLGYFDLVIIDEASQSDFSALPAILRAKKVLIVGDDKQVSPDGNFMEIDKIQNLMARYLATQVGIYRAQMDPGQSIYDLFKVVYANSTIMLKEHFRCVRPIIEYSKREFYNHELQPLRLPNFSERLDPPLIDVLVEDGFRNDKINAPEAHFIVDEIKKICTDEKNYNRTIGVISLLGGTQANTIFNMLQKELSPAEIDRYEITCGDARTFQGKERDIIFLSMVVSPNQAYAQTKISFAQRLNVAASRARDRMYLVRSIEADELSPKDHYLRNLIEHFRNPYGQDQEKLEDMRSLCESDFEREIYDVLAERGYRVIPQVKVGRFRIDMVVEGHHDTRLAIECDGDRYHGADQWESDMNRQRILERIGWQFWRCFASTFVKNRTEVINDLIFTLTEHGIEPIGKDNAPRSIHTEHRRVLGLPKQTELQESEFTQ
jgi:superfamily I DNA and/or RNA helicase